MAMDDINSKGERRSVEWIEFYPAKNIDSRDLARILPIKPTRRFPSQSIEDFRTPNSPKNIE